MLRNLGAFNMMKKTPVGNMTVAISPRLYMTLIKSRGGNALFPVQYLEKGNETYFLEATSNSPVLVRVHEEPTSR